MRAALIVFLCCALPARAADLFIEAELVPAKVYVGAEARLVLRLYRAPGVTHGTLRPPALGAAGEVSLLGVRTYSAQRSGVLYEVFERSNIVVAHRAGRLVVPGASFEGALSYEIYNRATGTVPRTARGPESVLEVLPAPAGAGEPFLPARSVTLEESWSRDPDALSTGTPVTRILVLRAEGLAADRLPRLEMAAGTALRVYHDHPEMHTEYLQTGMVGRRTQRIVLQPVSEGEVALPELSVRWWDLEADSGRTASLPGRTLRLQLAIAPAAVPAAAPLEVSPRAVLRGFAALLLLGAAAVLWLVLRNQALRDSRAKLRAACRRGDAAAAHEALKDWWQAAMRNAPAPRLLRMGEGWDALARAQLAALDAALYGGRAWEGRAFWRAVKPWLAKKAHREVRSPDAPFFRLLGR